MGKHVSVIAKALVSYATHAAQVTEMRKALQVDCDGMSIDDKVRLDKACVIELAMFYGCEYWATEKNGKLSKLTITQGAPSVALSRIRKIILNNENKTSDKTDAEKRAAWFIKKVEAGDKDAMKWARRIMAHMKTA
jgi:hypothetical protein